MAKKYIDVEPLDDGTFRVEAHGFSGKGCAGAIQPYLDALGKVKERVSKPEFLDKQNVRPATRVKA